MPVLLSHHIDERLRAPAEGTVTSGLGERVAQAVKGFSKSCMSFLGIVKGGASTW